MIADVEPLSGVRRYPSLPLGSSWERHNSALQSNTFPKQASGQHDLMLFGNEDPSSSGLAPSLLCPPAPLPWTPPGLAWLPYTPASHYLSDLSIMSFGVCYKHSSSILHGSKPDASELWCTACSSTALQS